jgi:hypothetical protein
MREMRELIQKLSEKSERKRPIWGDLCVDRRIILKWILDVCDTTLWTGFICLKTGTVSGLCEHGKEPSGSLKVGEFLD